MTKTPPPTSKRRNGFTLLEVLITLSLVALIFAVVVVNTPTPREKLETTLQNIERAVRFSVDEAALRNAVIRLRFLFNEKPQAYSVEFGPNDNFVIPANRFSEQETSLSLADQKKSKDKETKFDRQFNRIPEFKDQNKELKDGVSLYAVAYANAPKLQTSGNAAIYFFPSGEKDNALLIFATQKEVATMDIDPFTMDIETNYYTMDQGLIDNQGVAKTVDTMANDLFKQWQKK
jgi:prepilin-type N-terminal cleavage/methylation domain-containing protein